MKLFNILFLGVTIITLVSCGPIDNRKSFSDVTEYNDYIIDNMNIIDEMYVTTLDVEKGKEYCISQCDSLITKSKETVALLNDIQPYEGDSTLAMAAKDFCLYMSRAGKKDLPQFINLVLDQDLSAQDESKINTEATKIDKNYELQMDKVQVAQKAFAKKFNFIIK
jgi:hypothetical protein